MQDRRSRERCRAIVPGPVARLDIRPFDHDCLDAAADLLVRRHADQRSFEPSLSADYERAEVARASIETLLTENASGAFATRDGGPVGYLIGTPRDDPTWGPNVWVEPAGHAVAEAEMVRDLYAFAAAQWVADGRTSHYAVVPASDTGLVDAWFRLGFGQQHVHAVRDLPAPPTTPPGVAIRRPTRDDIPMLAELELVVPAHQQLSPVFSALPPPPLEEARAEWDDDFDNPAFATFVAVVDGRIVGSAIGCSVEESGLHTGLTRPNNAAHLGFAAVSEEARGAGVGTALGVTILDWATVAGYAVIVTDWRATNVLSSRTWPQLGFRPTFLRLFRAIT